MAYIYQADLWCDTCGSKICERLVKEGKAQEVIPWEDLRADVVGDIPGNELNTAENDALEMVDRAEKGDTEALAQLWGHFQLDPQYSKGNLEETSYDSDAYPKHVGDPGESDSPSHCAAGKECLEAEEIYLPRGTVHGRENTYHKVGALLSHGLTSDGIAALTQRLRTDTKRSAVLLWWFGELDGLEFPKDLYTVHLENSDDDPTMINATVRGTYADEWCDSVGSLCGSTWECGDGDSTLCYDSFPWEPSLIADLQAEGFDLDLSAYSDPDADEIAIVQHASECPHCHYDYHKAVEHTEGRIRFRVVREGAPSSEGWTSEYEARRVADQSPCDGYKIEAYVIPEP